MHSRYWHEMEWVISFTFWVTLPPHTQRNRFWHPSDRRLGMLHLYYTGYTDCNEMCKNWLQVILHFCPDMPMQPFLSPVINLWRNFTDVRYRIFHLNLHYNSSCTIMKEYNYVVSDYNYSRCNPSTM